VREESRVRLRTVRLRIEPRASGNAAACLALGLDDLKVTVRGDEVRRERLLELERSKEPTVHLMLLDMSGSVYGWLDYVRKAAEDYVSQLDPGHERGLLATFDDSLVLVQPATSDRAALVEASRGMRMGGMTGLVDAIYYMLLALAAYRERPVVVLLTDGVDSGSLHDRAHVNRLVEGRPDVIVFTIGLDTPFFSRGMRAGVASSKRFMQRLAQRSNGKYFDRPTGYQLDQTFLEIRSILATEAVLSLLDPDPDVEPGKIKVSSRDSACHVVTYREHGAPESEERLRPIGSPYPALPLTLPLPPDHAYRVGWVKAQPGSIDPACAVEGGDEAAMFRLEAGPRSMRACALDITMDTGLLYDFYSSARTRGNGWLEQRLRPLAVEVPPLEQLPHRPVELMDRLAVLALEAAERPIESGAWQVPVERHARPFHDWPTLCGGQVFFHTRARLAHGLFAYPQYQRWVLVELRAEARRELDALKERFRRYAPDHGDEELERVVLLSEEGRSILARAAEPSEVDLQRYLAAWLGDISAHDLFVEWERRRIDRELADGDADSLSAFRREWTALRNMFFVPSYARVLTVLIPVHDLERDRIGYWRVVLPRPGWLGNRVMGWKNRIEYSDIPLDLVPDRPLALDALRDLCDRDAELCPHLRRSGYRVESVEYELLGRPWKQ